MAFRNIGLTTLFALVLLYLFTNFSCNSGKQSDTIPEPSPARPDGARIIYSPKQKESAQNPSLSQDGKNLLFTIFHKGYNRGPAGLFILGAGKNSPVTLFEREGHDNVNVPYGAWESSMHRIHFSSDMDGKEEIYCINDDGKDLFRITHHDSSSDFREPSINLSGDWIVFEASMEGGAGGIWKVRPNGKDLHQLTSGKTCDDRQPCWSPAGDRILFQRRAAGSEDWDIYTMDSEGRDVKKITDAPSCDTDASWSPDGRFIVYSSDYGGLPAPNLFVIPRNGGPAFRATHDASREDAAPCWSPDGRWIYFESHEHLDSQTPAALYRISTAGLPSHFAWPDWTKKARIAGAFFEPDESDDEIEGRLDLLAEQKVNVVIADSPWGWSYSAWVDESEFNEVHNLVSSVVKKAHDRGIKVVMYQTGLELTSPPPRNPAKEHPDWAQQGINHIPAIFNDIENREEHWLEKGEWDFWVSPFSPYRQFSINRVKEMVKTGIDGLWVDTVYFLHSIGSHENFWASLEPGSAEVFQRATGHKAPAREDWDDPAFRRWIVWRHAALREYICALKNAARDVNPGILFFEENWNADTSGSTAYANDPSEYVTTYDISTGHEIGSIGDRIDRGEKGMSSASLDQWLSFRTMATFARCVDSEKPSWILTYGYKPRDSEQLAALVLAERCNFYETRGPGMADSVGAVERKKLFTWIESNESELYDGEGIAQIALIYSPRNRDLVDGGSGEPYKTEGSTHFAAYREAANFLFRAHIPFDIVIDTDTSRFKRYRMIILPEVRGISDETFAALKSYKGAIIISGDTGRYDEWMNEREENLWKGIPHRRFDKMRSEILKFADFHTFTSTAPTSIQLGIRSRKNGYSVVIANLGRSPSPSFVVAISPESRSKKVMAHFCRVGEVKKPIAVTTNKKSSFSITVPEGIETLALLVIKFID